MKKIITLFIICLITSLTLSYSVKCDEYSDWNDALDVYNSDGLDKPVSAVEYKKMMKELQELKDKHNKKTKFFWQKKEEPVQRIPNNEPIKQEKNDIIKLTTPLYYDGKTIPVGFYKIICSQENQNYYITLTQGKTSIIRVKANKVSHMDFCADKVNCLETKIYQDKYFKINFKTIDYAVSAYLTIVK